MSVVVKMAGMAAVAMVTVVDVLKVKKKHRNKTIDEQSANLYCR